MLDRPNTLASLIAETVDGPASPVSRSVAAARNAGATVVQSMRRDPAQVHDDQYPAGQARSESAEARIRAGMAETTLGVTGRAYTPEEDARAALSINVCGMTADKVRKLAAAIVREIQKPVSKDAPARCVVPELNDLGRMRAYRLVKGLLSDALLSKSQATIEKSILTVDETFDLIPAAKFAPVSAGGAEAAAGTHQDRPQAERALPQYTPEILRSPSAGPCLSPCCHEEMSYEPPHRAEPDVGLSAWPGGYLCACGREFTHERPNGNPAPLVKTGPGGEFTRDVGGAR